MARAVQSDNVVAIISAMSECQAGEVKGVSIPDLIELTGLTDRQVRTIVNKADYGFAMAQEKSSTGAATYYHDMSKMDIVMRHVEAVTVNNLDDTERLKQALNGIMNAVYFLDPNHKLLQELAIDFEPYGREGASKKTRSAATKNYFDWMLSEADIDYLAGKAKEDKSWRGKELIAKIEAGVDERLKEHGTPIEANRIMLADMTNSLHKWARNKVDASAVQDSEGAIRNALGILYMALKYNRLVS